MFLLTDKEAADRFYSPGKYRGNDGRKAEVRSITGDSLLF